VGVYRLRRSVVLGDNVTLRGSGAGTVLQRPAQVRSALSASVKPGDMSVQVAAPDGFEAGAEVAVLDAKHGGWYVAHRIVQRVEGARLHLDRPLDRDYDVARRAAVLNYFPGVLIENRRNAAVEDLCLDGRLAENAGPESDFTLAAVHVVSSRDCSVRRCRAIGWPSDGIGVQGGEGNRVTDCTVERCRGHGLHPGTSIRSSVFSRNVARRNAWDGLFFCAGCRHVIVSDSVFEANGWNGIGGLGNSDDRFNLVRGNICSLNARCGVDACDGDNNSIVGNICVGNSTSKAGAYPGIRLHNAREMIVTGNRCGDDAQPPTQTLGIQETGTSDDNLITANHCRTPGGKGVQTIGKRTRAEGNME